MQGIQRAEGVFRITRDQIRCFRKTCIIQRIPLQPATIDIVEKGCKQQILEFSRYRPCSGGDSARNASQ